MFQSIKTPALKNAAGYRSGDDARRMEVMITSMLRDRVPIALSSADDETLGHYSRLLVRDLRQQHDVRILGHLPGGTAKLLERFNDLVTGLPIEQVIGRRAAPLQPVQVFVVHDSPELSNEELMLMARLVRDLPGANLRIALIQKRDLSAALGPQAVHWRIEPPPVKDREPQLATDAQSRQELELALKEALREAPSGAPWRPVAPALGSEVDDVEPSPLRRVGRAARLRVLWSRARASLSMAPARLADAAPTARGALAALRRRVFPLARGDAPARRNLANKGPGRRSSPATGQRAAPSTPGTGQESFIARHQRAIVAGGLAASAAMAVGLAVLLSAQDLGVQRAPAGSKIAAQR